jgi:hypothetical protein
MNRLESGYGEIYWLQSFLVTKCASNWVTVTSIQCLKLGHIHLETRLKLGQIYLDTVPQTGHIHLERCLKLG